MRVPPTERKGRVHTSTITVAVFEGHFEPQQLATIHPDDIHERVTRGTGAGGQNRNKRETVIVLKHLPTGIEVKAEAERTQEANRRVATATLHERVRAHYAGAAQQVVNAQRKSQLGLGERSDKIRTYRAQDGLVVDHRTGKKVPLRTVLSGKLEALRQGDHE